jgi:ubiquinone/menaquinone biosynthesis C-methylase UbiE
MKDVKNYYLKKSDDFGWGIKSANAIDLERAELLDKFVMGHKVLDIGCASGVYVDYLSKKGLNVTGIDFVSKFLDYAKKNRIGHFLKADATSLPFEDNTFDTVILFDILEHVDDKKAILEAKRVTQKRIIATVPQKTNELIEQCGLVYRHHIDASHLRNYDKKSLEKLFKNINLKIIEIKGVTNVDTRGLLEHIIVLQPKSLTRLLVKGLGKIRKIKSLATELFIVAEKKK